jgi:hypothetical protein
VALLADRHTRGKFASNASRFEAESESRRLGSALVRDTFNWKWKLVDRLSIAIGGEDSPNKAAALLWWNASNQQDSH